MAIVYALIDITKPGIYKTDYVTYLYEPYYIGKGVNNKRPEQHLNESLSAKEKGGKRTRKQNKILKLLKNNIPFEYVIYEVDNECEAYQIEYELVELFGRLSEGGILTNVQSGGGGNKKGYVYAKNDHETIYVKRTDKRILSGEFKIVGFGSDKIHCYDKDGNKLYVSSDEYWKNGYTSIFKNRKRSEEARSNISKGKKNYKFTESHLANLTNANRIIAQNVHLGAKRKQSTKTNISKSRFGSKSKVANIWRLTSPNGDICITYKGGLALVSNFGLSPNRFKKFFGNIVPYPSYSGHINKEIINTTGWKIEKNPIDAEINYEFIFDK
jgi:hypothetical protein